MDKNQQRNQIRQIVRKPKYKINKQNINKQYHDKSKKELDIKIITFGQIDINTNTQRNLIDKRTQNDNQNNKTKSHKNVITFQQLNNIKKKQHKKSVNLTQQIRPWRSRLRQIIKFKQPKNFVWINILIFLWIPFNICDLFLGLINGFECLQANKTIININLKIWFLSTGIIGLVNLFLIFICYGIRLFLSSFQELQKTIFRINFMIIFSKYFIYDWIGYGQYFKIRESLQCQTNVFAYFNSRLLFECVLIILIITWTITYITQHESLANLSICLREKYNDQEKK